MPEYLDGIPKDVGASDFGDSSRLAGMMALVNHPDTPDLARYVLPGGLGVRVPFEDPYNKGSNNPLNFTRDQLLPLIAGLHIQGKQNVAKSLLRSIRARGWIMQNVEHWMPGELKKFPEGPDLLSPSARLALVLAAGETPSVILKIAGYAFFMLDLLWASIMPNTFEINQTIAVAYLLGLLQLVKYIRGYEDKLTYYWSGWRGEPELARKLINIA